MSKKQGYMVYAVVCANYCPWEIDYIYFDEADALARAAILGGMWTVEKMEVFGSPKNG